MQISFPITRIVGSGVDCTFDEVFHVELLAAQGAPYCQYKQTVTNPNYIMRPCDQVWSQSIIKCCGSKVPSRMEEDSNTQQQQPSSDINDELLIEAIHDRPSLWNNRLKEYSNSILRKAAWHEVFVALYHDFNEKDRHTQQSLGMS